jgi:hypothetical protein
MSAFNGRWTLTAAENFEALQNAIKASAEHIAKLKKIAEAVKVNPEAYIEEITVDKAAGTIKRAVYVGGEKKREAEAPLGKDTKGEATDGRAVTLHVTLESDTKIVRVEKGDGFETLTTIEVHGNELTATIVGGGVTSVEKFKKL